MKSKLSVSRVFSIFFLLVTLTICVFGKSYFEEAICLWELGEPSSMYYVESTIQFVDVKAGQVVSFIDGLGTFTLDLSLFEKLIGNEYRIGEVAKVLCDSNKEVLCLYNYYLNTFYLAIILAALLLLSALFSIIFFIVSFNRDDEDYYFDDEDYDLELEEQLDDDYKGLIIEYKSINSDKKIDISGGLYD